MKITRTPAVRLCCGVRGGGGGIGNIVLHNGRVQFQLNNE